MKLKKNILTEEESTNVAEEEGSLQRKKNNAVIEKELNEFIQ